MADVSNVVVEGQTYAFNDSNAETKIATLTSNQGSLASLTTTAKGSLVAAINEVDSSAKAKLPLSGGTLTGRLNVGGNSAIGLLDTAISVGSPPSSTHYGAGIRVLDAANVDFFRIQPVYTATNNLGGQISAARSISGTAVNNSLGLFVDATGARSVQLSDPAPWRTALGVSAIAATEYLPGDSVRLAGVQQYAGVWSSSTVLRFLIPASKSVNGRTCNISGVFIVRSSGKNSGDVTIGTGMTVSAICITEGIRVQITYSTAPSYAAQNYSAAVQPNNLVLTFS